MRSPICITGMHRSGTSLMAMLLHACGLNLGPERDLRTANADNRQGFWEDRRFVRLNDAILRRAGGAWDRPPLEVSPGSRHLRDRWLAGRARFLLRRSERPEPWGWKDPRTALTLPFWQSFRPELKVVICLRHPAIVDASLAHRAYHHCDHGESLWNIYNERLLAAVPRARRMIVAYDEVVNDPGASLEPVLEFVGLPRERSHAEQVRALVRREMQNAHATGCSGQSEALYRSMLAEAMRPSRPD